LTGKTTTRFELLLLGERFGGSMMEHTSLVYYITIILEKFKWIST